jgi:hypothetical protein
LLIQIFTMKTLFAPSVLTLSLISLLLGWGAEAEAAPELFVSTFEARAR